MYPQDQNSNPLANKLPNDPMALTLAIIGISLTVLGCCCGLFSTVPGVILSIVAFIQARNAIQTYQLNPEQYNVVSYKNMSTAKTLALVAMILSILTLVIALILTKLFPTNNPEYIQDLIERLEELKRTNA